MEAILKKKIGRESKDYLAITFGLVCYALGWVAFLLPYQITTGGVSGIAAIITAAVCPKRTKYKSNAGVRSAAIWHR